MARSIIASASLFALLLPAAALAEDDVPEIVDSMGVGETRFAVVPANDADRPPPDVDAPVRLSYALDTEHRDQGRAWLDPFVGREIYPELSARLATAFTRVKIANGGEPNGNDGEMALVARADVSLWFIDLRFPIEADRGVGANPFEVVLKAPFALGDRHRLAPLLVAHVPLNASFADAVVEAGIGYHYARQGLALKLEISAFDGAPDRTRVGALGGKLGWNGVLSYLLSDRLGVVVEADGTTAVSERENDASSPKVGDTIVRLLPGVRFFLGESGGFELGVAGLFTFVPDGYASRRHQGVLVDFAYTFF